MKLQAKRRAGLTLTEVLVSIFILSIGLMALMSLFPIGALRMAQAMKDDRCAQDGANAERLFRVLWKQAWLDNNGSLNQDAVAYGTATGQPAFAALDNRNLGWWRAPAVNQVAAAQAFPVLNSLALSQQFQGPGMPVYIDPIGFNTQATVSNLRRSWLAGSQQIPRRDIAVGNGSANPVPMSTLPGLRFSTCSLLDEYTYTPNGRTGVPVAASSPSGLSEPAVPVKREGNYNHAWLIQRPRNGVRHEVNLQVVIYRRRPAGDTATDERSFTTFLNALGGGPPIVEFSNTNNTIPANGVRITYPAGQKPPVRIGSFLLNASTYRFAETTGGGGGAPPNFIRQYANFHRVVSVSEPLANTIDIELASPVDISPFPSALISRPASPGFAAEAPQRFRNVNAAQSRNTIIFLDNVVEVFDRGTISAFDKPAP